MEFIKPGEVVEINGKYFLSRDKKKVIINGAEYNIIIGLDKNNNLYLAKGEKQEPKVEEK